jgi:hypothetical protein
VPVIRKAHWRGLTLIQCEPGGVMSAQSGPLVLQCYRSCFDHRWTATFHLEDQPDTDAPRFTAGADGADLFATLESALQRLEQVVAQSDRLLLRCEAELQTVREANGFEMGEEILQRKKAAKKMTKKAAP